MAKKKTFLGEDQMEDNPAMSFISQPKAETEKEETKSRRVQLVMRPGLYQKLRQASAEAGLSVNEYCHRALETAVDREHHVVNIVVAEPPKGGKVW